MSGLLHANINPNTGARVAEAVIVPTASNPLDPGFGGPIVVTLAVSGVTFKGFTVDGDNPSLTSGVIFNGADVDAEFGIYGTETANPDAPSLQFDVDCDLNDPATAYQGRLVFEPYLSPAQGPVAQNVWQNWDARGGMWYGTRTTVTVNNVSVAQPCQPATPCTWSQVLALYPNAGVHNAAGSAVLFKVGGPWAPGFDGNVDNFRLRHNGSLVTYNFENVP